MVRELVGTHGADEKQIAHLFGVNKATITTWKKLYPEFRTSLNDGRDDYDTKRVEVSLVKRATGYTYEEEHIDARTGAITLITRHVPPSDTAIIFWLKNRQRARWRDVREEYRTGTYHHEHSGEVKIDGNDIDRAAEVLRILRDAGALDLPPAPGPTGSA